MVAATRSAWNKLLFQQSVTLENSRVKLVPLKREFYSGLLKEALDPRIWAFPFAYHLRDETSWNAYFEDALR
jgi:hypothetical protein